MELEDKIYGEERMFYGEMKFPEFMFRPSQLTENVSLYCDTTEYDGGLGYTVLQSTICAPCLPGTLFNPNDNNCTRCPLNTYQDQLAARSCTRCRRNYYTHRVGTILLFFGPPAQSYVHVHLLLLLLLLLLMVAEIKVTLSQKCCMGTVQII